MIKHQGGAGSRRTWLFALALLLYAASSATAQVFTGRIDVTVQDATGAVLPGVTVEVLGPQNQNAATDAQGEAHLLNLPPGTYQVKATLAGFSDYVNRAVEVRAGASVPLRVSLSVGGVTEQVQVSIDSPIVDPKR